MVRALVKQLALPEGDSHLRRAAEYNRASRKASGNLPACASVWEMASVCGIPPESQTVCALASDEEFPRVLPVGELPFLALASEWIAESGAGWKRAGVSASESSKAWEPVECPPLIQERASSSLRRSSGRAKTGRKQRSQRPQAPKESAVVSARPRIQNVVAGSSQVAQAPNCF